MKVSNSQKNVSVNVAAGDNPRNAVQGLLRNAMNRTQTRPSADVPVTAEMAAALGIPARKSPSSGRQGYRSKP